MTNHFVNCNLSHNRSENETACGKTLYPSQNDPWNETDRLEISNLSHNWSENETDCVKTLYPSQNDPWNETDCLEISNLSHKALQNELSYDLFHV